MEAKRPELFFTDRVLMFTIAFSILEIYLSWKALHRPAAGSRQWITIFGLACGAFIMASLMARGKFTRDKALGGLFLAIIAIWLFLQVALLSAELVWVCRLVVLGFWVTAVVVEICFLFRDKPKRAFTNHQSQITN